jgi:phosphoglycerate dehydrogenase-like enzyme
MVNRKYLRLLKDGAILLNTSRGGLIDQNALLEECRRGRIIAVLDVTDPEPLPFDSPLRRLRNVIITPHIAGLGLYGYRKIGEIILKGLEDFFAGRNVENAIDFSKYEIIA